MSFFFYFCCVGGENLYLKEKLFSSSPVQTSGPRHFCQGRRVCVCCWEKKQLLVLSVRNFCFVWRIVSTVFFYHGKFSKWSQKNLKTAISQIWILSKPKFISSKSPYFFLQVQEFLELYQVFRGAKSGPTRVGLIPFLHCTWCSTTCKKVANLVLLIRKLVSVMYPLVTSSLFFSTATKPVQFAGVDHCAEIQKDLIISGRSFYLCEWKIWEARFRSKKLCTKAKAPWRPSQKSLCRKQGSQFLTVSNLPNVFLCPF